MSMSFNCIFWNQWFSGQAIPSLILLINISYVGTYSSSFFKRTKKIPRHSLFCDTGLGESYLCEQT